MNDYSELKRLAEAASKGDWSGSKSYEFMAAANPAAVLALISEVEGLRAQHGRDSAELRNLCQARDDARKEREQLRAEVEALRKDAEFYRWLRGRDLETIHEGGVFAGQTPENLVLNGNDLDLAIAAAMGEQA